MCLSLLHTVQKFEIDDAVVSFRQIRDNKEVLRALDLVAGTDRQSAPSHERVDLMASTTQTTTTPGNNTSESLTFPVQQFNHRGKSFHNAPSILLILRTAYAGVPLILPVTVAQQLSFDRESVLHNPEIQATPGKKRLS
jgi:hypothetical protein